MLKAQKSIQNYILIPILIGLIPVLWSNSTLDPKSSTQFISLSVALIALLIFAKKAVELNRKTALTLGIFGSFIIYSIFSLFNSTNSVDGVFQLSEYILYFILAYTFSQFSSPKELFKIIYRTVVVLSFVVILPGISELIDLLQTQKLTFPNSTYNIHSLFPHRNIFSQFILILLPFCIYAYIKDKKAWKYLGLASSTTAIFFIIILSNRTTWLAFIVATVTVILALIFTKKAFRPSKKSLIILLGSITLALTAAYITISKNSDVESLKTHTIGAVDSNAGSTKDRLELWKRTYALIKEEPILGHGIGSWKIHMLKYGNKGLASENNITFYQRPHNDFLWIFAEQGIIGLLLYLGFFTTELFILVKTLRSKNSDDYHAQLLVYLSVIISYLVIANLSFPKERICHNIILYSSIGLLLSISKKNSETERPITISYLKYLFILILGLLIIIGSLRYKGEMHTRNAMDARAESNFHLCISEVEKAKSFIYQMDETSTPIVWQSGLSYFRLGNFAQANKCFEEAKRINPHHIYVLNDYGSCLSKMDRNLEAIENYKKALAIAPNFLDAKLNLCAIYFGQKKYKEAFELLKGTEFDNPSERLKKTVILVTRNLIKSELKSTAENEAFAKLFQEEYNNFEFYKNILAASEKYNCDIKEIINNSEKYLQTQNN